MTGRKVEMKYKTFDIISVGSAPPILLSVEYQLTIEFIYVLHLGNVHLILEGGMGGNSSKSTIFS